MTIPSETLKPFMAYLPQQDYARLKKLSKFTKVPMSQLVREGVSSRLSGNQYNTGFNDGLQKAVDVVKSMEIAGIRFPSGNSVGDLIENATLDCFLVENKDETDGKP